MIGFLSFYSKNKWKLFPYFYRKAGTAVPLPDKLLFFNRFTSDESSGRALHDAEVDGIAGKAVELRCTELA